MSRNAMRLRGSVMSGSPVWATIGPIVLLVGIVLIAIALVNARRLAR